jgi:hypothetical protein
VCDNLRMKHRSTVFHTYRLNILSPILLPDSRVMLSPNDSSLFLSFVADRRCEVLVSAFGVRLSDAVGVPSFDAPCTLTTGIGVSRFASDSELVEPMLGGGVGVGRFLLFPIDYTQASYRVYESHHGFVGRLGNLL